MNRNPWSLVYIGTALIILLLVATVALIIYQKKPLPLPLFPLNNSRATYVITTAQNPVNTYCSKQVAIYTAGKYIRLRYEGDGILLGKDLACYEVLIGRSRTPLTSFVGKKVKVTGQFTNAAKQCVGDQCENIGGPWVVLDVDEVREQ